MMGHREGGCQGLGRPLGSRGIVLGRVKNRAAGRTVAVRAILRREEDRGPDVLRLGNALSALDPRGGEETRLLDAMRQAVP